MKSYGESTQQFEKKLEVFERVQTLTNEVERLKQQSKSNILCFTSRSDIFIWFLLFFKTQKLVQTRYSFSKFKVPRHWKCLTELSWFFYIDEVIIIKVSKSEAKWRKYRGIFEMKIMTGLGSKIGLNNTQDRTCPLSLNCHNITKNLGSKVATFFTMVMSVLNC